MHPAHSDGPPRLRIKQLEEELSFRESAVVCAFTQLLDLRDIDTGVHSTRLAEWAVRIADALGLPEGQHRSLEIAAMLHDIGKVGISDEILHKPSALTTAERVELEKHPEYGWAILRGIPGFETAALYILHHHERMDGRGYPSGLRGEHIPLGARIIAAIDAFDAMISDRCYRSGLPLDEVCRRMREAAGTQFDRRIVEQIVRISCQEAPLIGTLLKTEL